MRRTCELLKVDDERPERRADPAGPKPHFRPLRLSVVICTLNEGTAIGPLLVEIDEALAGLAHEIIVVDDDSTDDTAAVVEGARRQTHPHVRLIVRKGVRGLASAAVAGWDAASGEHLALMDGDGQHDPALLRSLMAARWTLTAADLAVGARDLAGEAQAFSAARLQNVQGCDLAGGVGARRAAHRPHERLFRDDPRLL